VRKLSDVALRKKKKKGGENPRPRQDFEGGREERAPFWGDLSRAKNEKGKGVFPPVKKPFCSIEKKKKDPPLCPFLFHRGSEGRGKRRKGKKKRKGHVNFPRAARKAAG